MASKAAAATSSPEIAVNIFTSLPTRPPTPPREAAASDTDASLRSAVLSRARAHAHALDPRRSLQTPPSTHSPSSIVPTGSFPSSSRARKKVEWSSHTEYNDAPDYCSRLRSSPLSAPSSTSSRPVKGILKPAPCPAHPCLSSFGPQLDGATAQPNIVEMLDSAVKQLAGPDRDSRLDAYMMLARALKSSNNLPDRVALQDKMSLFTQFIQRDVMSKNEGGSLDTSLINHALNLLATFLSFPAIASTIASDFAVFLIDHAIRSFEDASVPKDVVRHLMQVVALQSFSAKVLTSDRVGRLVSALHGIQDHLKGKSIVMSRIWIYKRLAQQSPAYMVVHSDWLKDLFTDMLSTIKEIRAQAISLGSLAGFSLRSDKMLARKVADIFKGSSDGENYVDFYIKRLQGLLKDRLVSSVVPQIWSVVILFLRCPLDRWQYYGPWLTLVQTAFNMPDLTTKQEANNAWNRYVYLSLVDSKLPSKSIKTLCQPLLSQLKRRASAKQHELRRVVMGGVCSLYYFSFAQGNDKYPVDVIWDAAIQPVISQLVSLDGNPEAPGDCMMQAARILVGLLDIATPRPSRNMTRIMSPVPLTPEELLPIDSKWVRKNCDKVLQAVGPVMEKKFTDLANKESLVSRLWQALVGTIAAASAKDIKVSDDTTRFLACSFNLLSKVWSTGLDQDDATASTKLTASAKHFAQLLVGGLGVLPFTERKLSLSPSSTFEPVATSQRSDKPDKAHGVVQVPLYHLFSMLCSTPPGCSDGEELSDMFQAVFEPFFRGKSVKARSELARELLLLLPRNALCPYGPWLLAAENMRPLVNKAPPASGPGASASDKFLGPEYRQVVSLLERGLRCHPNLPASHWQSLFGAVSANIGREFGDAGRALVLVEPVAKALLEESDDDKAPMSSISVTAMLFDVAKVPRDGQALDAARLRLWGAPPALGKATSSSHDPFDSLYRLGNLTLASAYDKYPESDASGDTKTLLQSVGKFMDRCMSDLTVIKMMSKMQHGLCPWVRDAKTQLRLDDQSCISRVVRQLWDRLCIELTAHKRLDRKDFDQVEALLTAAFTSQDSFIVSRAANVWNAVVKDEEKVECSDSLMSVVSSLRSRVDLFVPGAGGPGNDFGAQESSFFDLQEGQSPVVVSSASTRHNSKQAPSPLPRASKRLMTRKRVMELSEADNKPAKRAAASRLRHDDSQIHFSPVAPPTLPDGESQHLTERQREVRERQQENAALYPGVRSSPAARPFAEAQEEVKAEPEGDDVVAGNSTPKRGTLFDEMVRSTPTPRRGQVLPMDDMNDPPSSPPVPRPYPLLPEIQSRSRANSSLENWQFSSPTSSPTTTSQRAPVGGGDTASPGAAGRASQPRARRPGRKQRRSSARLQRATRVIASSVTDDDNGSANGQEEDGHLSADAADLRGTPPQRHIHPSQVQGSPDLGDDEFVDARSSPVGPAQRALGACRVTADETKYTSFALSQGDESGLVDLVDELERRGVPPAVVKNATTAERRTGGSGDGAVYAGTPPPGPVTRGGSRRLASQAMASTAADESNGESETGSRRKRKRSQRPSESWNKRRRSREADGKAAAAAGDAVAATAEASGQQSAGRETRRSARKRRLQASLPRAPETRARAQGKAKGARDGGDTDEELLSQLATESFAASQTHDEAAAAASQTHDEATAGAGVATAGDRAEGETGGAGTLTIMEALRRSLDKLRGATLDRAAVYEVEDMLMDLKRELFEAERRGRERKEGGD